MERLIGAILLRAIEDWRNPQYRLEVENFFNSEWFKELVESLELRPDRIRESLRNEKYHPVKIRSAYR